MQAPDGWIHRQEVLERGWTAAMADRLTHVHKLGEVPANTSNKCYLLTEVHELEQTDPEIRRAVQAKAAQMPRRAGGYAREETVGRSTLLARGWTAAHITRLLGAPDLVEEDAMGQLHHRYGLDRVDQAVATDVQVQRRLERVAAGRREQAEQAISETLENGRAVWRRVGQRWLAQGKAMEEGEIVEIARKDGSVARHQILRIVRDDLPEGGMLAEVSKFPVREAAATSPARGSRQVRQEARPAAAPRLSILLPETPRLGTPVRDGRDVVVYTRVVGWQRISEDDPSIHGSQLLGYEGERGVLVEYRPATGAEVATLVAAEEALRATAARAAAAAAEWRALADQIKAAGECPTGMHQLAGDRIGGPDLYGAGTWFVITDHHLWYVENNGMDGDRWDRNNVVTFGAGAIGWRTARTPDLEARIRALTT